MTSSWNENQVRFYNLLTCQSLLASGENSNRKYNDGEENVESDVSKSNNHAELVLYPQTFPITQATERDASPETIKKQLYKKFHAELENEVETHF